MADSATIMASNRRSQGLSPRKVRMARILVILNPGAEEIETVTVGDCLVRAGQQVIVASSTTAPVVTGSRGLPLAAHTLFDLVRDQDFDAVYCPGGVGSAHIHRDDPRIQDLLQRQLESGRILAVICAAVLALIPRRLAVGRRVTSYPGVRAEVEPHVGAWIDEPVVCDGALITSQGPGTALALGLHLASVFAGDAVADTVAQALLVPR